MRPKRERENKREKEREREKKRERGTKNRFVYSYSCRKYEKLHIHC